MTHFSESLEQLRACLTSKHCDNRTLNFMHSHTHTHAHTHMMHVSHTDSLTNPTWAIVCLHIIITHLHAHIYTRTRAHTHTDIVHNFCDFLQSAHDITVTMHYKTIPWILFAYPCTFSKFMCRWIPPSHTIPYLPYMSLFPVTSLLYWVMLMLWCY